MRITIQCSKQLALFSLVDLNFKTTTFANNQDIMLPEGWYQLNLKYNGEQNEIQDIHINGVSIGHILYTGYTENNEGEYIQSTAVWKTGHTFKIWLHTNLGVLFDRVYRQVHNNYFGTDLSKNYMLTVSRPKLLSDKFNTKLKDFFGFGDGPNWWNLNDKYTPYRKLKNLDIDKSLLLNLLQKECINDDIFKSNGYTKAMFPVNDNKAYDMESIKNDYIKNLCKAIGYVKINNVYFSKLEPAGYIDIHIDDNITKNELQGCTKFYYELTNATGVHFKLGQSGLLPLEYPLLINTSKHTHAVVNDSTDARMVCYMYGQF